MTTNNNWNKNLAADLPAPRDDEPQSLRDDIVAELQDHLACALHRERHATGDEDRAQKNVIEKFGNPAAIAYRLWWDAMKEKIMSQRILIGTVLLLAIACLAATGFAWIAVQEGREVNQLVMANSQSMMETNRTMMESSREVMEKLTALAGKPAEADAPDSIGWVRVQLKLVTNEEGGPPAEGFKATLMGTLYGGSGGSGGSGFGGGGGMQLDETSGPDGMIDFRYVTPGKHRIQVVAPWGDILNEDLAVQPGTPVMKRIVCPSGPTRSVKAELNVEWPEDLANQNLDLVFRTSQKLELGSNVWQPALHSGRVRPAGISWLLERGKNVSEIAFDFHVAAFSLEEKPFPLRAATQKITNITQTNSSVSMHELPLDVHALQVLLPSTEALAESLGLDRFDLRLESVENGFPILATWPHMESQHVFGGGIFGPGQLPQNERFIIPASTTFDTSYEPLRFDPKPGEENVWTIELPESLIARTREALKAIDEFKAEHAPAESAATE